MKYAKMLGLLAVAAAALMAFASSASATTVTSPTGTTYTGEIHAVAGETTLHGASTITCNSSTSSGTIETHSSTTTAHGPISHLTFAECNQEVTVLNAGRLEVHTDEANEVHPNPGKYDGTLTSDDAAILIHISGLGITCEYTTNNTPIGTLHASKTDNDHAILTINSSKIPRTGGSVFCGANGVWTGEYKVTTPTGLYID